MLWMQFLRQDPVVSCSSRSQKLRRPDRLCLRGGDFPAKAWFFWHLEKLVLLRRCQRMQQQVLEG